MRKTHRHPAKKIIIPNLSVIGKAQSQLLKEGGSASGGGSSALMPSSNSAPTETITADMPLWKFVAAVPKSASGGPVQVHVQLYIHSMSNIDLLNNCFDGDFYMVFKWATPKPDKPGANGCRDAWWPRYDVMNQVAGELAYEALECTHARGSGGGGGGGDGGGGGYAQWKYTCRHKGKYALIGANERLWIFPFDVQYLTVDMSFWPVQHTIGLVLDGARQQLNAEQRRVADSADQPTDTAQYVNDELYYVMMEEGNTTLEMSRGIKLFEWDVSRHLSCMRTMAHKYDTDMFGTHPRLQFEVPVRRRTAFYFNKIVSVSLLCNCICGGAFFIELHSYSERTGIALSTFLSLVAFQFVVTSALPRAPWTVIDEFFMASYLFTTFVLLEGIVAGSHYAAAVESGGDLEFWVHLDWYCAVGYISANFLLLLRLFFQAREYYGKAWHLEIMRHRPAVRRFYNLPNPRVRSSIHPEQKQYKATEHVEWADFKNRAGGRALDWTGRVRLGDARKARKSQFQNAASSSNISKAEKQRRVKACL
jgi:hypothetical protein